MENDLNKLWAEYIKENSYATPEEFLVGEFGFILVTSEIVGTWRWGNIMEDVYTHVDGSFLGVTYHDVSGDSDIDAFGMMAEFYPVEEKQVTITKYVRV